MSTSTTETSAPPAPTLEYSSDGTTQRYVHVQGTFGQQISSGPLQSGTPAVPIDLSGFTVTAELQPPQRQTPLIRAGGTGDASGFMRYTVTAADFDREGSWSVRLYADNGSVRYPSGLILIDVLSG